MGIHLSQRMKHIVDRPSVSPQRKSNLGPYSFGGGCGPFELPKAMREIQNTESEVCTGLGFVTHVLILWNGTNDGRGEPLRERHSPLKEPVAQGATGSADQSSGTGLYSGERSKTLLTRAIAGGRDGVLNMQDH